MAEIPESFVPIHHADCGQVAFYVHPDQLKDTDLHAKYFRRANGSVIVPHEEIQCTSCGRGCDPPRTTAIRAAMNGERGYVGLNLG